MSDTKPIGKNRLKRAYVNARRIYVERRDALHALQDVANTHLPNGVLAPAIDLMFDLLDEAERPYRELLEQCVARGIQHSYGCQIHHHELSVEHDHEDYPR